MDLLSLKDMWPDTVEFTSSGRTFKRDTKVRDFMNKIFDANLVAVYSTTCRHDLSKGQLDWSGEHFITISKSGKVSYLFNSEWAHFDQVKA